MPLKTVNMSYCSRRGEREREKEEQREKEPGKCNREEVSASY